MFLLLSSILSTFRSHQALVHRPAAQETLRQVDAGTTTVVVEGHRLSEGLRKLVKEASRECFFYLRLLFFFELVFFCVFFFELVEAKNQKYYSQLGSCPTSWGKK